MPTLKDLSLMTSDLDRLGGELHAELTEGDIDFSKLVELADSISENADKLAAAFNTMSVALKETLSPNGAERDDGEDES